MGREPDRIGYFSFTRKATTEAINRAVSKFNIERKNLEWFRTLHSCAYRWLNLSPSDIIGKNEFLELYKETGIDLHDSISSKDNFTGSEGDGFSLLDLYRVKNTSLEKELYDSGIHVKGGLNRLLIADKLYRVFKKRKGVMDFTDIIMKFNKIGLSPNLGVVIIDEVQDLKPIEWDMVRIMMKKAEKVYLAGDDDQAIYSWSGADVSQLINLPCKTEVLKQSYRIPNKVFYKANKLISRVSSRIPKDWKPREEDGEMRKASFQSLNLEEGEWLILARTNYYINEVAKDLMQRGLFFEKNNSLSISEATLSAYRSWTSLQKGKELTHDQVKKMYQYIPTGQLGITRGMKKMTGAKQDEKYSYDLLFKEWGLNVDINLPWDIVLQRIPEHEKFYMRNILSSGHDLDQEANIKLSTIHGAKGGESQNVVVFSDISKRIYDNMWNNRDDERRVFYVAMTRAKQNLYIIPSSSQYQFEEIL